MVIGGLVLIAVIISIVAVNLTDGDSSDSIAWQEKKVLDRIKPLGEVATTAAEAKQASPKVDAPEVVTEKAGPLTAEQVYNTACLACHTTGAAGAPKVGDIADWAPRIAQGDDVLFEHATKGFKGMPPRGGSPQLTDKNITDAIQFMVRKSQ
ncbi:MAG: cytochrome c, class I [Piscirickettsiaceae bacterium]|nr:MAG: cytochrome c, class I [Piscirickettsiaceae bacterium]